MKGEFFIIFPRNFDELAEEVKLTMKTRAFQCKQTL